ncbi:MAG: tetratricopeptide repeat protein [Thermodesulfobacteriota bacterium]|nr:tetratricopeptide repeat protein [Thermodesulfobacteriota bacterium]
MRQQRLSNTCINFICLSLFILSSISLLGGCSSKDYPFAKNWLPKQGKYKSIPDRHRQELPIEEIPKKEPDLTAEEYEKLGDQYLQQGNMDESFIQYNKTLELNPGQNRVRYKVGLLFLKRDLPNEALKQFQKILEKDTGHAPAYEGRGQAFMQKGKYDEAEKNFQKALQLNLDLWLSHNGLGMIYDRKLRFYHAIAHYKAAINIKPDQYILLNNLGMSYYLNGEYKKSAETLLKAIEAGSDPKNAKVYNNLGLVLGKLDRYEEALEAFKKAGDRPAAYNNLGYCYFLQGKYEEAIAVFEKAIDIKPSFYPSANKNLKMAKKALEQEKMSEVISTTGKKILPKAAKF